MAKSSGGSGGYGGAMFAMSAMQSIVQIMQGYNAKKIAGYNAAVIESKMRLLDIQRDIESGQYTRMASRIMSKGVVAAADSGVAFSGSKMAVMIEAQKEINIDKAIGRFNFEIEKGYVKAEADAQRRAGDRAVQQGYAGALSSLMGGASNYAMYKGINTSQGAKRAGR